MMQLIMVTIIIDRKCIIYVINDYLYCTDTPGRFASTVPN